MATNVQLFDIDTDLLENPETKDFKDIYNIEAINQSIDIFLTNPYRIGVGITNTLFLGVFSDIKLKSEIDIEREIELEFDTNYPLLILNGVFVEKFSNERRLKVTLNWTVKGAQISGTFERFWEQR